MADNERKSVPIHRGVTFGFHARNGYFGSPEARRRGDETLVRPAGPVKDKRP
jgi:hypothetical protein